MSDEFHDGESSRARKLRMIADFWRLIPDPNDLAGTSGRSLVDLRREAMDCLKRSPPDYKGAQAATAQAIFNLRTEEKN